MLTRRKLPVVALLSIFMVAGFAAPAVGVATATPDTSATARGSWVSAWSAAPQGPATLGSFGAETLSGTNQVKELQNVVPPPATFSLHQGGSAVPCATSAADIDSRSANASRIVNNLLVTPLPG